MARADKMSRTNKPAAVKVVKEGRVQIDIHAAEAARYVFWSTTDRRIAAGPTQKAALVGAQNRGYSLIGG